MVAAINLQAMVGINRYALSPLLMLIFMLLSFMFFRRLEPNEQSEQLATGEQGAATDILRSG